MPDEISYIEHAQDVLEKANDLIERGDRFTLISSVAIKGGTARELGSLALVTADGDMFGYLSNGCIDQDIRVNAVRALDTNERRLVHYGEGSPFPDLSLPCGGMLKVLLDPRPDLMALRRAYASLKARQSACLTFNTDDMRKPVSIEYAPKPRVMLAGRGAVFRATAHLAHSTGFDVICLSPDETDVSAVAAWSSEPVGHLTSPNVNLDLKLDRWSAFLTLFHDHSWEPSLLRSALKTPCRFIGALGSQRTHDARTSVLLGMGCSETDLKRINGPVGLVPSLRSADLIAVAVVAELAAAFSRSQRTLEEATPSVPEEA